MSRPSISAAHAVPPVGALLLSAAEALADVWGAVRLRPVAVFPGSERSRVVRAAVEGRDGLPPTVVVKATSGIGGARERAALGTAAAARLPHVVPLLAACDDVPVVVLADLGDGPTLADRLMATDAQAAEAALLAWSAALGTVQAGSTGLGSAFSAALGSLCPLGPPLLDTTGETVAEAVVGLRRLLPRLGVAPDPQAERELSALAERLRTEPGDGRAGLVPGDTCPSNAVETANGPVLLDFEGAEFRHLAWEAAYLTVPWPTCWCSWDLPEQVRAGALAAWRAAAQRGGAEVTGPRFEDDLAAATTAWAFVTSGWLLGAALDGDPPRPADKPPMPGRRALLQHGMAVAARHCSDDAPALRRLAEDAGRAMVRAWGRTPLPLAHAFR